MATPFFDQLQTLARGFETGLAAREEALATREIDLEQKFADWRKTAEDFSKAQAIVLAAVPAVIEEAAAADAAASRIKPYKRREETTVHADTNKAFKGTYYESTDGSRLAWAKYNDTPKKIARRFQKLCLEVNEIVRLNLRFYTNLSGTTKLATGTVLALNIGGRFLIEAREIDDVHPVAPVAPVDSDSDGMRVSIQGNIGGFSKKSKRASFGGRGATLGGSKKRAKHSREDKHAVILRAHEARAVPSRDPVTLTPAEVEAALFSS